MGRYLTIFFLISGIVASIAWASTQATMSSPHSANMPNSPHCKIVTVTFPSGQSTAATTAAITVSGAILADQSCNPNPVHSMTVSTPGSAMVYLLPPSPGLSSSSVILAAALPGETLQLGVNVTW